MSTTPDTPTDSTTVVDNRYGQRRFGDPAKPPAPERRSLEEMRDVAAEDIITDREALGSGFRLATDRDIAAGRANFAYDFVPGRHGRMATVDGIECFGRDLALGIAKLAHKLVGVILTPEELSDLGRDVADRVRGDQRTQELISYDVSKHPDSADSVIVEMQLVAENGELHEDILNVDIPRTSAGTQ